MIEIASTTNPIFRYFPSPFPAAAIFPTTSTKRMTFSGVVRKAIILSVWTIVCAVSIWKALLQNAAANPFDEKFFLVLLGFSGFAPFAIVVISIWNKPISHITAPIYAILQGVFFGFIAVGLEPRFPGVAMQAISLSCCTCIALGCSYDFGFVRVSDHFNKKFVFAVAGSALYLGVAILLSRAGFKVLPVVLHGRGAAFCALVAIIAGITFIHGYDLAAKSAEENHPEYMEWHAALGLILSLVWLYLEGLRIFFKDRVPNEANKKEATVKN
jgi:uncharacterized YccA/Bax inhibitor family protein